MNKPAPCGPRHADAKWLMGHKLPPGRILSNLALAGMRAHSRALTGVCFSATCSPSFCNLRERQRPLFWSLTRAPASRLLRHLCEARFSKDILVSAPGDVAERLKALVC